MSDSKNHVTDFLNDPRTQHWDWIQDYERVKKNSKAVWFPQSLKVKDTPVPLSLALKVMEEVSARPEVMAAYGGPKPEEDFSYSFSRLQHQHNDYLCQKYGTRPSPITFIALPIQKMARGMYTGIDDPALAADLLECIFVYDDGDTQ